MIVIALTGVGLVLRFLQVRGIWVDEAISVHQAHMSLPGMLANLRETDNHPPLFFLALWATLEGTGVKHIGPRLVRGAPTQQIGSNAAFTAPARTSGSARPVPNLGLVLSPTTAGEAHRDEREHSEQRCAEDTGCLGR